MIAVVLHLLLHKVWSLYSHLLMYVRGGTNVLLFFSWVRFGWIGVFRVEVFP